MGSSLHGTMRRGTSTFNRPNKKLFLDLVGTLPETRESQHKFILTLQDDLTKYPQVYPMRSCSAEKTAKLLVQYISHMGIPKVIATENGTKILSDVLKLLEKLCSIKHIFASPYHPQTCRALKRNHSTRKDLKYWSYIGDNLHA